MFRTGKGRQETCTRTPVRAKSNIFLGVWAIEMLDCDLASTRKIRASCAEPFRAAVAEANAWMIMTGFNRVNGTYCSESGDLLGILRQACSFPLLLTKPPDLGHGIFLSQKKFGEKDKTPSVCFIRSHPSFQSPSCEGNQKEGSKFF